MLVPGQANQVVELNVSGGLGLNKLSKREEAPYAAEDAHVVGLNFNQSKEVLIADHAAGSNGDVSMPCRTRYITDIILTYNINVKVCFNGWMVFDRLLR